MDRKDRFNKWFNVFILAGMTLVTVAVTAFKLQDAESGRALLVVAAFGSLCGVLANVLSANGRILTFLFGLLDVAIYGVICLTGGKYGNAALHLLYFLPMQVVGFVQWKGRGAGTYLQPGFLVAATPSDAPAASADPRQPYRSRIASKMPIRRYRSGA